MDFYSIIEKAKKTGKVDKGSNEVTKAVELGVAKLVLYAADVNPKEIVAHLPLLCKEKNIPCFEVDSKQKLGISVGIPVGAAAVAVVNPGETDKEIAQLKIGIHTKSSQEKAPKIKSN
ncbi:50S ribosomal protein L7ae [Candidatus Pacearchaeota archaeon]|nr:50S ribosomal protein L7ae [Candidatus Pacearchaeota archaeon]